MEISFNKVTQNVVENVLYKDYYCSIIIKVKKSKMPTYLALGEIVKKNSMILGRMLFYQ